MSLTLDQLAKEALLLPAPLRAELADILVESLGTAQSDEVQSLWINEAIRRRDEVRSGQVQPIPGEQVMAEARRLLSGNSL